MGQPEPPAVPAVAAFARSLRDLRQAAGQPTLSQLAQADSYSGTRVWEGCTVATDRPVR